MTDTEAAERAAGLCGRHIWVTRPADPSDGLVASLRSAGARVLHQPTALTQPLSPNPFRDLDPRRYRVWVFTSRYGVRCAALLLRELGQSADEIAARLYCVGPTTATSARGIGFRDVVSPDEPVGARALAEWILELHADSDPGILFPCADGARPELPQVLRDAGLRVDALPIYRTTPVAPPAELWQQLRADPVDALLFTSPSAVSGFLDGKPDDWPPTGSAIAAIGPTTADALAGAGLRVDVIAPRPASDLLVAALRTWFEEQNR